MRPDSRRASRLVRSSLLRLPAVGPSDPVRTAARDAAAAVAGTERFPSIAGTGGAARSRLLIVDGGAAERALDELEVELWELVDAGLLRVAGSDGFDARPRFTLARGDGPSPAARSEP